HDLLIAHAHAFHSDLVDGAVVGGVAIRDHVGQHVLDELRAPADHRAISHPTELMNGSQPAYDPAIADDAVSPERGVVAEDTESADVALMPNVGVGAEEVVGADPGLVVGKGRRVHRAELAKDVALADPDRGVVAGPFLVL